MTPAVSSLPSSGSAADDAWAIVLAAGIGRRFGEAKQFARVAGKRLVDLALETATSTCEHVVLVIPQGHPWDGADVDLVVPGGYDRSSSVRRALAAIPANDGIVVVHQAANPLASAATIRSLRSEIDAGAVAAAPGLQPPDLVRRVEQHYAGEVVGRDDLVLIQTPAAFRLRVLREVHDAGRDALEDTELVTAAGYQVRIVPGDPRNVHVTTTEDLQLVAAMLLMQDR